MGEAQPVPQVWRELLDTGLVRLGFDPPALTREQLISYLLLLVRWNRTFNLTGVREPLDMIPKHIFDSLTLNAFLCGERVLDVGTGAGLPGIPLAITNPQRSFVLLDSNGKKTRFVTQATQEIGLSNVKVVRARVESYQSAQKFDTIVARALSSARQLYKVMVPLLERSGHLLLMKGRRPEQELANLGLQPSEWHLHRLHVPLLRGERHLIEIIVN